MRTGLIFAALMAALIFGAADARADTILFEAEIVLEHRTADDVLGSIGADTLGLDGATLVFRATFETTDTYIDRFGFPSVDSTSESLTITGASVASTNGVRSSATGVSLWPDGGGQYYSPAGFGVDWSVGGFTLSLWSLTNAVLGISIGDNVALSDFSTTQRIRPAEFDYGLFTVGTGGSLSDSARYDAASFAATATPVPEPGSVALLGLGLLGLGIASRRRKARAS